MSTKIISLFIAFLVAAPSSIVLGGPDAAVSVTSPVARAVESDDKPKKKAEKKAKQEKAKKNKSDGQSQKKADKARDKKEKESLKGLGKDEKKQKKAELKKKKKERKERQKTYKKAKVEDKKQGRKVTDDRNCTDFDTTEGAQRFFVQNGGPARDPHDLDRDGDGRACEALS